MEHTHHEGEQKTLEEWILILRTAITLDLPDRSMPLDILANALKLRYDESGKIEDLEECIGFHRDALSLRPTGHPDRAVSLSELANGLQSRYDRFNNMEDLENCILFHHEAIGLRPLGHPKRSTSLNNLAIALMSRHARFGKMEDLEECILLNHQALGLRPPGHPDRSASLNNLGIVLLTQFERFGKIEDLQESISFHRSALTLRPPGDPFRSSSLNNLAIALTHRGDQFASIEDLDECISLNRDALILRPLGHPKHSMSLNNLASALMSRYCLYAKIEDLEECISFHREALALRPPGHPDRFEPLNNLANAVLSRYDRFNKTEDLEDCILFYREGPTLRPPGHPRHSWSLHNLANALMRRYNRNGKTEDLEECILLHRNAVILHPPGNPHRSKSLDSLALALRSRYDLFGKMEDLDDCILFHRDALNLCPPGHGERSAALNNLANALGRRYLQFRKTEDLEDCILFHRDTLVLRPHGHPDHSASLYNLGRALINRHIQLGRIEDLQETCTCYEQAASDPTSHLNHRLLAAVQWALTARDHKHTSILDAYRASLDLVNRSLILRARVESQHGFLATINIPSLRSLACDAASAAIGDGNLELAVEFLEHGRAMLWSKVDAYKYPLMQLRQVDGGAVLAERLKTLSAELEYLVLLSDSPSRSQSQSSSMKEVVLDAQMKQHRILSEEWESLVGKIREIEGFSSFLQAPPFSTLQSATADGPVILVNISRYRSDAIILNMNNPPILVALPELRLNELNDQAKKRNSNREIKGVLRYLWDNIASPIVDRLSELGIKKKSRIWWCPTGVLCALPLHAASRGGQKDLPSLYTSSYTSTLSSLMRARSDTSAQPFTSPKLLIVGQPSERQKLERVEVEVDVVRELVSDKSVDVLFGPAASCEAVLDGLKQHSWVHFACHGHLGPGNGAQPFQASFELDGGRHLPLLDLIRARIPNAELAFLSACHSAAGGSHTPDESIHLSAALQFCGFRSVIGTLWEMDDEDGPTISEEFYKYMFRNPGRIDFRDSAHALSSAIRAMRKDKLPPERWVMFVHIGA